MMVTTSVFRRFVFTFGATVVRSGINFLTGLLVARWLGPDEYGRLAFLLGTFVAIRNLVDAGTSSAFFTFMSQTPRSRRFVASYFGWLGLQLGGIAVLLGAFLPDEWLTRIWKDEDRGLVVLAWLAVFLQSGAWQSVSQLAESRRRTEMIQSIGTGIALVHLGLAGALWVLGTIGVFSLLLAVAVEHAFACTIGMRLSTQPRDLEEKEAASRTVAQMYWTYCAPMLPYVLAGFAAEFADRWILQHFGGNVEQAYYAVGAQFAAVALIAATSILRIFWKEVAEANHRGDIAAMSALYRKVTRMLYFAGACLSGLLIPWTGEILGWTLGQAYAEGATTLAIMLLYPIHQSLGQVVGALLYATEKLWVQVASGIATMLTGVVAAYFVLAPTTAAWPGLGLGAEGLAWKMVVIQCLNVNIVMYVVSRIWRWRFEWSYQLVVLSCCLVLGMLASVFGRGVAPSGATAWVGLALAGLCYAAFILALVARFPVLAGTSREELTSLVPDRLKGVVRRD